MAATLDTFLLLAALGFGVGAYGTLIGAGGGFLLVPLLLLLDPDQSPAAVTAMSLTVVFFNAYAGTWAYARMRRIDFAVGLQFAAAGIPGAILGVWAVQQVPRGPFEWCFSLLLLAAGMMLVAQPLRRDRLADGGVIADQLPREKRSLLGSLGAAYLGVFSSFMGVGGGILHVPFMVRVLRFPPHTATATSQFVLLLTVLAGATMHLLSGSLNGLLAPTAFLALGVMMGAPVGAALSGWLRGPLLLRLLALALIVVAGRLMWRMIV